MASFNRVYIIRYVYIIKESYKNIEGDIEEILGQPVGGSANA